MALLKHVKDPGPVSLEDVFGDPVDAAGRTKRDHDLLIAQVAANRGDAAAVPQWEQRSMTFGEFVLSRLLDQRFGKGMEMVLLMADVQHAVREMKKTGWLSLPRKHWEELSEATDKAEYPQAIRHCFTPFMVALVKQAVDELPPDTVRAGADAHVGNGQVTA